MYSNRVLALLIIWIGVIHINAAQIWVSPNGSSGADGTFSKPYAGVKTGIGNSVDGDTVIMKAGTYSPLK